jgi:UPF0716 protein FxsA
MFLILLVLFVLIPVIEISLFIEVGNWIGLWPTISIIFVTAFTGAVLVRHQGLATLTSAQQQLQRGEMPAEKVGEGLLLAIAGVLLLTPGFLTDFLGLILLIPPIRQRLAKKALKKLQARSTTSFSGFGQGPFQSPQNGDTFDGQFERKVDPNDPNQRLR